MGNYSFPLTLSGTSLASMVMSADHPSLTFTLSLLQSKPTFHQQNFVSDFAVSLHSDLSLAKQRKCQLLTCSPCSHQHYPVSVNA